MTSATLSSTVLSSIMTVTLPTIVEVGDLESGCDLSLKETKLLDCTHNRLSASAALMRRLGEATREELDEIEYLKAKDQLMILL